MPDALRPYQREGAAFLAAHRHALLADEMRLGKTVQAVTAAGMVRAPSVLVVCPAIAVSHWHGELIRWWPEDAPVPEAAVLSYDRAKSLKAKLVGRRWGAVIVDESHYAKNPEAQRTKLIYGKGGLGWVSDRMWALSGTPAPNHAGELWTVLFAFGAVKASYGDFIRHYCRLDPLSLRPLGTREDKIPELRTLLAKVMLRRKRKDVAPELPDIGFDFLEIEPTAHPDFDIPEGLTDDEATKWVAERVQKEDRIAVAKAKVPALANEIWGAFSEQQLKQTVVFGWHLEPLHALGATLRDRGMRVAFLTGETRPTQRDMIQSDFRAGQLDVVLGQIKAAGTAIDLSAARHAYFLELHTVPGDNLQAANRMVSMMRDDKVTVDVASWPGSADGRVQKNLLRKVRELSRLY